MWSFIKAVLRFLFPQNFYEALRLEYGKIKKRKNEIKKQIKYCVLYPLVYSIHSKKRVDEKKVFFLNPSLKCAGNGFDFLWKTLHENFDFNLEIIHLGNSVPQGYTQRVLKMLKKAATAKYVFIDEACDIFGNIKVRPETKFIQLFHACGAFKRFGGGVADKIFGPNREGLEKYPQYNYIDAFFISSPEVLWAYKESTFLPEEKIIAAGVSRTDIFFCESFKNLAKQKFYDYFPEAKDKKIILFSPTFRGSIRKAKTHVAFSVGAFFETLRDKYVIAVKHHPCVKQEKRGVIPAEYKNFVKDMTDVMNIEELLCLADICITDYSSLIFEYSLFEKPMIFFAYDIDSYYDNRGFYYDYDEMTPGPVLKTNHEIIEYIQNIDKLFDKQTVIDFKNKFMTSCDGHSTERVMNFVFEQEQLNKHKLPQKKQTPAKNYNIALCVDNASLVNICVLLETLKQTNINSGFTVLIFSTNLKSANKDIIKEQVWQSNVDIMFFDIVISSIAGINRDAKKLLAKPQYLRWVFPLYVPERIEKILYLENDFFVTDDLQKIFVIDISDVAVASTTDGDTNSCMMINLPCWEKERLSEKAIDFFNENFMPSGEKGNVQTSFEVDVFSAVLPPNSYKKMPYVFGQKQKKVTPSKKLEKKEISYFEFVKSQVAKITP